MNRYLAISAAVLILAATAGTTESALPVGPTLTVTGMGITPIVTTSIDTPPVVIDVASGAFVTFCWTGDASAYGGTITDYRWGFDVADPGDPTQWDVNWTAFDGSETCNTPHVFYFGTHTFTVDIMDNYGSISRASITMTISNPLAVQASTWGAIKALYR
ncbi:MAG TPA: hypothetical protein VFH88_05600 [Candidatus Krumholzibacteria bacterium]|nr:hypothetical protein [Candidatus Krumholzibacteria bacterium]